jgi:hypothetical protein
VRPIGNWFWAAVAVSLIVSLTPWAEFILYPFRVFTTWVHECGHALMTVLVAGRVASITIEPDVSGLTHSPSRWAALPAASWPPRDKRRDAGRDTVDDARTVIAPIGAGTISRLETVIAT